MEFLTGLNILILTFALSSTDATTLRPISEDEVVCANIEPNSICSGIGYQNASFPNFREHATQTDAEMEITDFMLLFQSRCSSVVQDFFCSYYFPFCTYIPKPMGMDDDMQILTLQPCGHYCTYVRERCEPEFNSYPGLEWPVFLNCSLFPDRASGKLCNGPDEPHEVTVTAVTAQTILPPTPSSSISWTPPLTTASLIPSPTPRHCSPIETKACMEAVHTNTTLSATQTGAEISISMYQHAIQSGCSEFLVPFLCLIYTPECRHQPPYLLQPCKELCLTVMDKCKNEFDGGWPDDFTCSRFPCRESGDCSEPSTLIASSSCHDVCVLSTILFLVLLSVLF